MSDKKTGRPSTYSKEKAKDICQMIESGMTLLAVAELDDMPTISTIYDWIDNDPEFADNYARARQRQADTFASMVMTEAFNAHDAQIGRLRIDALKWTASKLAPKKYGDKVEIEQTGNQNFKISFNVPERENAQLHAPVPLEALPAATPQIIDISPERIPDPADSTDSGDITPDREQLRQ
jgi:hypothetical protein